MAIGRQIVRESRERKEARKHLSGAGLLSPAVFFLAGMLLFSAGPAWAQGPVDLIDTWNAGGLGGWTNSGPKGNLSNPGGYLRLAFGQQSKPDAACDLVRRTTDTGIVITNLSFAFRAENTRPSAVLLYVHSNRSGNSWYVNLGVDVVGAWIGFNVPLTYEARWITGPDGTKEQFLSDIQSIDWIGVYVIRGDESAQNYGIDNVWITGVIKGGAGGGGGSPLVTDNNSDGIPDSWEVMYGMAATNAQDAANDNDHDGMSNYAEYRAGTHPNRDDSRLEMNMSRTNRVDRVEGVAVKWSSVAGRSYRVLRTTDLMSGFTAIETGIVATPPENEYEDITATNSGPYFYKVQVE